MKNLLLVLFVLSASVLSSNLQAQTTCTPAQQAACKKICADQTKCTPAQVAACKKTCDGKVASTQAVKVVNQAPAKTASCNKSASAVKSAAVNETPVKLVGLNLFPIEAKKTECAKPCVKKD